MWIVKTEEQGYISYEIYENKPIVKEDFPTERTCSVYVENYEQANYLISVNEDFIDILPFNVYVGEPIEFDINCLNKENKKEIEKSEPVLYHYNLKMKGDADPDNILKGKKLKDIAIYNGCSESENSLIILFNDNTYIDIGLDYNSDNEVWRFKNNFVYLTDTHSGKDSINEKPLSYGYVDKKGKYHINSKYENYVKLGILKYSDEAVELAIKQNECMQDQKDYAEYLRLKAKFEGVESVKKLKYTV